MQKSILLILLILAILIQATHASIVAVLEVTPGSENIELEIAEFRHLTDELRKQATEALPKEYTVLTRDNIFQLIPPDEEEAECLAASCTVEIGRAIGADYVAGGQVNLFQGMLTLTVELYESASGKLISSFVVERESARGLLAEIREKAPNLFGKLASSNGQLTMNNGQLTQASMPANYAPLPTPHSPKSKTWLALGLDILGVAAIGFGVYQQMNANSNYKDYKRMPEELPNTEQGFIDLDNRKSKELQKVRDAEKLRNVGYAVGAALLAAGISVHMWF